jgi:DNA replication protein DnaC
LTDEQEYNRHSKLISGLAKNYLRREFRDFVFDEHNRQIFRFLAYYFNGCELAESVFPNENYKINKNLLLIGRVGTGKTLTMQIFADYLKFTQNKNQFLNVSQTQMMNYQKIHGHIDFFTFNEINSKKFEGNPYNICLNDIGLETEAQKSYGTSLDTVIDEFLYARYEIYQQQNIKYHLTSNLNVDDFKKRFGNRLIDRFKSFNILIFDGASRRM